MTNEQREHIAATIGMMDMIIAIMKESGFEAIQNAVVAQAEVLQDMLDNDYGSM